MMLRGDLRSVVALAFFVACSSSSESPPPSGVDAGRDAEGGIADAAGDAPSGVDAGRNAEGGIADAAGDAEGGTAEGGVGPAPIPAGVYAIWPVTDALTSSLTGNKGVVGVLLSVPWNLVNPTQGKFDWSAVTARLSEAVAAGMAVEVALKDSPLDEPSWIASQLCSPGADAGSCVAAVDFLDTNDNRSTYCTTQRVAVPWDPAFHAARLALIKAFGQQFPTSFVAATASFANFTTDDWELPHFVGTVCGQNVNQVSQLQQAGYTTSAILAIGKDILDATAAAFPGANIKLPIQSSGGLGGGDPFAPVEQIIAYATTKPYASRFYPQMNFLKASDAGPTDPSVAQATNQSPDNDYVLHLLSQAAQMGLQDVAGAFTSGKECCRQSGDLSCSAQTCDPLSVLQKSSSVAASYHAPAAFWEVWKSDGSAPSAATALVQATKSLGGAPRP